MEVAGGGRDVGGDRRPRVDRRIVTTAVICRNQGAARVGDSAPDDHFRPRPNSGVEPAHGWRAAGVDGRPEIGRRAIASAVAHVTTGTNSAPDNHLAARPHRGMEGSRGRRAVRVERRPGAGYRVVTRSVTEINARCVSAPNQHFAARPLCAVKRSPAEQGTVGTLQSAKRSRCQNQQEEPLRPPARALRERPRPIVGGCLAEARRRSARIHGQTVFR